LESLEWWVLCCGCGSSGTLSSFGLHFWVFFGFLGCKVGGCFSHFFNDFFFPAGFVFISLLGGSLAWLSFDFLVYYFGLGKMSSSSSLCYS
jgi:hypothetical protein